MVYRVVTRKSRLARKQAELFVTAFKAQHPNIELNIIQWTLRLIDDLPVESFGGKGSFVKELEDLVLSGFADCAVHSMKDMSVRGVEGLMIGAIMPRRILEMLLLVMIFSLAALPAGAIGYI